VKPHELVPSIVAHELGVSESTLWFWARTADRLYKEPRTICVKGKLREIDPPVPLFKKILRRLHRFLQREFRPHRAVHGGAKGRSCFTSANVHKGKKYIVTRDIRDCYPSITTDRLTERLLAYGFPIETAHLLGLLMTRRGRIPQGSPVSSDALNFYLDDSDRRLNEVCSAYGARYSRVYDDTVVSVDTRASIEPISRSLDREISRHGLKVNDHKRKDHGIRSSQHPQHVHNIDVRSRRGTRINRQQTRQAIALAEAFVRGARCVSPDSLEGLASKRAQLTGWINYCSQAHFNPAKHLRMLLRHGDTLIATRLQRAGVFVPDKWWVQSSKRNEPKRLAQRWRNIHPRNTPCGTSPHIAGHTQDPPVLAVAG
jgi:hypothetical protein